MKIVKATFMAALPVMLGLYLARNLEGLAAKQNVPFLKQLTNGTLLSGG